MGCFSQAHVICSFKGTSYAMMIAERREWVREMRGQRCRRAERESLGKFSEQRWVAMVLGCFG